MICFCFITILLFDRKVLCFHRLVFCPGDELMGQACRLGQAVFGCTRKGDGDCVIEYTLVADGDEQWFDIRACSKHGPDNLLVVH